MIWAIEKEFEIFNNQIVFDIFSYKNPKTDDKFHIVEKFLGNNTYVKGETPTQYTSKFIDKYSQRFGLLAILLVGNIKEYEWK